MTSSKENMIVTQRIYKREQQQEKQTNKQSLRLIDQKNRKWGRNPT